MGWQPVPKSDHKDLWIDSGITIMVSCVFSALFKEPLTMAMWDRTPSWNSEHSNGSLPPKTQVALSLFSYPLKIPVAQTLLVQNLVMGLPWKPN